MHANAKPPNFCGPPDQNPARAWRSVTNVYACLGYGGPFSAGVGWV